jgi:transposase
VSCRPRHLLARVRPRDLPGQTRRELAAELIAELKVLDAKLEQLKRRLRDAVIAAGS